MFWNKDEETFKVPKPVDATKEWEEVIEDELYRVAVPGGWIYSDWNIEAMVFVPKGDR